MNCWRGNVPENNGAFPLLMDLAEEIPERSLERRASFCSRLFRVRHEIILIGQQKKILPAGMKGGTIRKSDACHVPPIQ